MVSLRSVLLGDKATVLGATGLASTFVSLTICTIGRAVLHDTNFTPNTARGTIPVLYAGLNQQWQQAGFLFWVVAFLQSAALYSIARLTTFRRHVGLVRQRSNGHNAAAQWIRRSGPDDANPQSPSQIKISGCMGKALPSGYRVVTDTIPIADLVLGFLNGHDVAVLQTVSKGWASISARERIWQAKCHEAKVQHAIGSAYTSYRYHSIALIEARLQQERDYLAILWSNANRVRTPGTIMVFVGCVVALAAYLVPWLAMWPYALATIQWLVAHSVPIALTTAAVTFSAHLMRNSIVQVLAGLLVYVLCIFVLQELPMFSWFQTSFLYSLSCLVHPIVILCQLVATFTATASASFAVPLPNDQVHSLARRQRSAKSSIMSAGIAATIGACCWALLVALTLPKSDWVSTLHYAMNGIAFIVFRFAVVVIAVFHIGNAMPGFQNMSGFAHDTSNTKFYASVFWTLPLAIAAPASAAALCKFYFFTESQPWDWHPAQLINAILIGAYCFSTAVNAHIWYRAGNIDSLFGSIFMTVWGTAAILLNMWTLTGSVSVHAISSELTANLFRILFTLGCIWRIAVFPAIMITSVMDMLSNHGPLFPLPIISAAILGESVLRYFSVTTWVVQPLYDLIFGWICTTHVIPLFHLVVYCLPVAGIITSTVLIVFAIKDRWMQRHGRVCDDIRWKMFPLLICLTAIALFGFVMWYFDILSKLWSYPVGCMQILALVAVPWYWWVLWLVCASVSIVGLCSPGPDRMINAVCVSVAAVVLTVLLRTLVARVLPHLDDDKPVLSAAVHGALALYSAAVVLVGISMICAVYEEFHNFVVPPISDLRNMHTRMFWFGVMAAVAEAADFHIASYHLGSDTNVSKVVVFPWMFAGVTAYFSSVVLFVGTICVWRHVIQYVWASFVYLPALGRAHNNFSKDARRRVGSQIFRTYLPLSLAVLTLVIIVTWYLFRNVTYCIPADDNVRQLQGIWCDLKEIQRLGIPAVIQLPGQMFGTAWHEISQRMSLIVGA
jgi:hypothetical protein